MLFWNPSTRKSRILPKLDIETDWSTIVEYGFCYDESTDDFKLLALFGPGKYEAAMYSLTSDSWTMIGDFPFEIVYPQRSWSAIGAVYWVLALIHSFLFISFDV